MTTHMQQPGLRLLPVELLYEIQLYALSPALPCLSQFFLDIFKGTPISFRVQFLLASCTNILTPSHTADILSKALRYPLCTLPVLDQLYIKLEYLTQSESPLIIPHDSKLGRRTRTCEIPRRIFRALTSRKDGQDWRTSDEPLPFIQHLLSKGSNFPAFDPNSHQGYALTRAVHARHTPLIRLLLQMGASPTYKEGMAVKVAIKQKNLKMVKLLVERDDRDGSLLPPGLAKAEAQAQKPQKGKRRRLEDRIEVDQSMLKLAVKCNAGDIIDYFAWEKGVVPDMQTLTSMTSMRK
ncbi:hypothetical protein NP233_g2628 [Leucocoprinus birnbaumii]|uniref:Uncharacterized protein n=1 Tax=Leucocoprinus birnbaumii TaxID=56174 RepID=A0AAD5VXY8_9AGAR|nr:hypothetical protein NP233_g2628 [Leucocoprinus birnbaumii]